MKRCVACGAKSLAEVVVAETTRIGARTFTGELSARKCRECGETYYVADELASFELDVASELVRQGDRCREAFRFMRKVLGLPAQELARLFDVDAATVSRWETGQRDVPFLASALLATMVVDRQKGRADVVDCLNQLHSPKSGRSKNVRLNRERVARKRS